MDNFFGNLMMDIGLADDTPRRLERMVDAYCANSAAHAKVGNGIRTMLEASPDLRARTLECVGNGYLQQYGARYNGPGAASFSAEHRAINIPSTFRDPGSTGMLFTLGHETEHARSGAGTHYVRDTLHPAIQAKAREPGAEPRDYTGILEAFVQHTRAEEGRAHLGGFNAVASYVLSQEDHAPQDRLRAFHEACPERMGDFIARSKCGLHAEYDLRPGLSLADNGLLPYSPNNIEAMKGFYADKAALGEPYMNYRQYAIQQAALCIHDEENKRCVEDNQDRRYIIDGKHLQAHQGLGLPADGLFAINTLPDMPAWKEPLSLSTGVPSTSVPSIGAQANGPRPMMPLPTMSPQAGPGEHPLFAQALPLVAGLDGTCLPGDPQAVRNLAAALACAAHDQKLTAIDSVMLSHDGNGLIASQGQGPTGRNAGVDRRLAAATPEQDSLARLPPMQEATHQQTTGQTLPDMTEPGRRTATF